MSPADRSRRPSHPATARPPATPRQRWRTDGTRVASLALATLVIAFFLLYLWIPAFTIGSVGYEQWLASFGAPRFMQEVSQIAVLAASLVLTALIVVPALLLTRAGRPPTGALLLVIAVTAVAITAIREFSNPESLVAFLAAGATAEVLAALAAPAATSIAPQPADAALGARAVIRARTPSG